MISVRFQNAIVTSLVGFVLYSSRLVLNIAALDMVKRADTEDFDIHLENSTCYEALDPSINVFVIIDPMVNFTYAPIDLLKSSYKFDWDEGKIGILNAAYYFGYVPAIIPGTIIGEKMGYFNYVSTTLFLSTFLTISFPIITITFGFYGAVVGRIILGMFHGPISSIIAGLWYYWALQEELTTTSSFYQFGAGFGLIFVSSMGGYVLSIGYSWPMIFYLCGILYFIITVIFFIRADNRPEPTDHFLNRFRPFRYSRTMSPEELKLLVSDRPKQSEEPMLPWKKLCTYEILWFNISWFSGTVAMVAFHTYVPRFIQYFMMSDMGELTKFMTFQSIFSLPMLVLFCSLSDVLRKYFPTPIVRKTMYIIPSMIFIAGLFLMAFHPCNNVLLYIILTVIGTANAVILTACCKPIPNEIGGKFASQVYCFSNTINNVAGIIAPVIMGMFLKMGPINEIETWYHAGIFTVSIQLFGAVIFLIPKLTVLPFTLERIEEDLENEETFKLRPKMPN